MTQLNVNGNNYSDDKTGARDLTGGGHRQWLLPMFGDALTEIAAQTGNVLGLGTRFAFDAGTGAADPGAGLLSFNNAAAASATAIYIDSLNAAGGDVSGWLALMGSQRGQIHVRNASGSKWRIYGVNSVTANGGWSTISVSYGAGIGTEFTAAETLILSLAPGGPAGSVSAAGDGTISAPGIAFASETGLGIRRKSSGVAAATAGGADLVELREASQAEAEAGANALAVMSARRVLQAIRKNAVGNVGGQTVTGDVTLTSSSAGAIIANPSAPGFFATLPAANTLGSAGPGVFSIYNAGDFDYGLRDNTGTRLGWIPPRGSVVIDAVDITTAAGVWGLDGIEKLGVTARFANTNVTNMGVSPIQTIDMGSSRTLFLLGGSNNLYGLVHDGPTRAWGALTLIRSGVNSNGWAGLQTIAGTQALVCSYDSATGTALQAVVLSIAGTTITVNTPVATTLTGAGVSAQPRMIAVGSSYCVAYGRATTTIGVRAITISGTTPTIGAEAIVASSVASFRPADLYVSGSVLRVVTASTGTAVLAQPYTVSGVTLTAGTSASVTATANGGGNLRTYLNSNGRIVAFYVNTTPTAAIFNLSGTTETVSSVSMGGAHYSGLNSSSDVVDLGGGKTLFAWLLSGQTQYSVNILTDTAGSAAAGTAYVTPASGNTYTRAPVCLFGSASLARLALPFFSGSASSALHQYSFSVSGASPTLSTATLLRDVPCYEFGQTDEFGRRSAALLRAGSVAFLAPITGVAAALNAPALLVAPNSTVPIPRPSGSLSSPAALGANEFQSWFAESFTQSTTGVVIEQWECAA